MFFLQFSIKGEEKLFRGEILAIIAAIRTKLALPDISNHRIVPVSISPINFPSNQVPYILTKQTN